MGAAGVVEAQQYAPKRIAARWEELFEELQRAPRRRSRRFRRETPAIPPSLAEVSSPG
jgi:hypothetical protein